MKRRPTDPQLDRARQARRNMTAAETMMWRALRDRGIGAKFRRQVTIGPYIADFVCIDARLIVEIDGATHERPGRQIYDAGRDEWLRAQGWHVLRFPNDPRDRRDGYRCHADSRGCGCCRPSSVTLRVTPSPASGRRGRAPANCPTHGTTPQFLADASPPWSARVMIRWTWLGI